MSSCRFSSFFPFLLTEQTQSALFLLLLYKHFQFSVCVTAFNLNSKLPNKCFIVKHFQEGECEQVSVPEQEGELVCSVSSTLEDTERHNDEESQQQSSPSDLTHTHTQIII